ncbi:sialate O-acetylesterase [Dysgonomonas sp. PFB1-18]|uniref:sialate O-acetylesterase n=1 Tax=unclassified Dysgonomonas TaxID=2630389 RepID=UPI0024750517|nr:MULTISPECIES: sialate O-acetylesterase [unclassified Dysgonomonas]MDH6310886.1 sialate O-acetylesterase [Dysgonomonas sp. PF1-14]MDH6341131.1 sialate O-acetylesterase [Dysgonomonas sp. PF1-16]MDH6382356.1 sialate O-acetylesterase [Dysgonomonas sp. PFB1-18]MDH6399706.1 sialate O-acetylesterase [Dysgonomonas sp. PF1-23]
MNKIIKTVLIIYCLCFGFLSLQAEVTLPSVFSDNMVIQQNKPIRIWGWADKNESVEVRFLSQVKKAKADKDGKWKLTLNPVSYGGPYSLEVKGKSNNIVLKNILIGEVWLCSGQSNMEWTVKDVNNANSEIDNANYPQIRSFNVVKAIGMKPEEKLEGEWQVCSPSTVANFSAVGYFFARKLNQELNIPIGIINSSWGGTDIETWTSPEAVAKLDSKFMERYKDFAIKDLDVFTKESESSKVLYMEAMSNDPGMNQEWYKPSYNTASWKKMQIPQLWENVLGQIDGIVWFKYTISLPEEVKGKPATIHLGTIDDDDITWINGVKIGETGGYTNERVYNISKDVLTGGTNTIIVKVTDYAGGGGIYGEADNIYLEAGGKKYPLAGEWLYKEAVTNKEFNYIELSPNMYPSLLYNAMINPIIRYGIKGTIWYQGENNAGESYKYRTLFPTMINDWRTKWGYEFPFYWVQLANYMAKDAVPTESGWAELREAQTMTLSLPQTGQAVITDIGDADDIHPRNKQDVGLRLALVALNKDYGKKDIVYSGPAFKSMNINGNKAVIEFSNADKGFVVKNKYGYIDGFAIAGADKKFVWAKAYIDGNKIVVSSDRVQNPVAVRYSWGNNPDVNLFNTEGLPAVPFRTDNWKGITQYD